MPDPYDVLGVKRGASPDEIKAAYRRASKQRHPDMPGGSNEAMVELNTAYAFVLNELKQGYQRQEKEEARQQSNAGENAWHDVHEDTSHDRRRDTRWRDLYREIDEEIDNLRNASEQYDAQLRRMRDAAWQAGQHAAWAKLTLDDLFNFFKRTARSGIKGLAVLFAALIGVGSVLVEANFVSALILLGSGVGFAFSLALRSDKGGVLSAALLLFGVMTIWLPPVRAALLLFPLATVSVLILLALIFKFAQAGGTVGLMTGGVLALFVISAIVNDTAQHPAFVGIVPRPAPSPTYHPTVEATQPVTSAPGPTASPTDAAPVPTPTRATPQATVAIAPPEPRTLLASDGAILKFVSGVPYHLKVRNGRATSLKATLGAIKLTSGDDANGACVDYVDFPRQTGSGPWTEIDRTFWACGDGAVVKAQSRE